MIIGITGSFGSGKTTVAKMFARLGAYRIDADKVYHSLVGPRKKLYKKIVRNFGCVCLKKNAKIDMRKLAQVVFNNRSKLRLLNALTHPEVIKEINRITAKKKKSRVIIIDAPLLIESGFYKKMEMVVVTKVPLNIQINRIIREKGMTKKEALNIVRSQATLKKKLALADFIIDNSGSKRKTFNQVRRIWKILTR